MWDYDKGSSNDFLGEVSHGHRSPLTNQASAHPGHVFKTSLSLLLLLPPAGLDRLVQHSPAGQRPSLAPPEGAE